MKKEKRAFYQLVCFEMLNISILLSTFLAEIIDTDSDLESYYSFFFIYFEFAYSNIICFFSLFYFRFKY